MKFIQMGGLLFLEGLNDSFFEERWLFFYEGEGFGGFDFFFDMLRFSYNRMSNFFSVFFNVFGVEDFDVSVIPASDFVVTFFHFNNFFFIILHELVYF